MRHPPLRSVTRSMTGSLPSPSAATKEKKRKAEQINGRVEKKRRAEEDKGRIAEFNELLGGHAVCEMYLTQSDLKQFQPFRTTDCLVNNIHDEESIAPAWHRLCGLPLASIVRMKVGTNKSEKYCVIMLPLVEVDAECQLYRDDMLDYETEGSGIECLRRESLCFRMVVVTLNSVRGYYPGKYETNRHALMDTLNHVLNGYDESCQWLCVRNGWFSKPKELGAGVFAAMKPPASLYHSYLEGFTICQPMVGGPPRVMNNLVVAHEARNTSPMMDNQSKALQIFGDCLSWLTSLFCFPWQPGFAVRIQPLILQLIHEGFSMREFNLNYDENLQTDPSFKEVPQFALNLFSSRFFRSEMTDHHLACYVVVHPDFIARLCLGSDSKKLLKVVLPTAQVSVMDCKYGVAREAPLSEWGYGLCDHLPPVLWNIVVGYAVDIIVPNALFMSRKLQNLTGGGAESKDLLLDAAYWLRSNLTQDQRNLSFKREHCTRQVPPPTPWPVVRDGNQWPVFYAIHQPWEHYVKWKASV